MEGLVLTVIGFKFPEDMYTFDNYLNSISAILVENGYKMMEHAWGYRDFIISPYNKVRLTLLMHPNKFPYTLVVAQYVECEKKISGIKIWEHTAYTEVAKEILVLIGNVQCEKD